MPLRLALSSPLQPFISRLDECCRYRLRFRQFIISLAVSIILGDYSVSLHPYPCRNFFAGSVAVMPDPAMFQCGRHYWPQAMNGPQSDLNGAILIIVLHITRTELIELILLTDTSNRYWTAVRGREQCRGTAYLYMDAQNNFVRIDYSC